MSHRTLRRISPELQYILKVHEIASQSLATYGNVTVRRYMEKSNAHHPMFSRDKLRLSGVDSDSYNVKDFSPVVSKIIAPIFKGTSGLGGLESLSTDDLLHPKFLAEEDAAIVSERNHSVKNKSDHLAKVMTSFASACSPSEAVPPVTSATKSFHWYRKLLSDTPVIIFLKQKQRLLSDSNLHAFNRPLSVLTDELNSLTAQYKNNESLDKRIRNYHLTDLNSIDIFELAVSSEGQPNGEITDPEYWSLMAKPDDKLCRKLVECATPRIVDADGHERGSQILEEMKEHFPLRSVHTDIECLAHVADIHTVFPYDVLYSDLFMLTIEAPVLAEDHIPLLNLIEAQTDFETVAVRISTENGVLSRLSNLNETPDHDNSPSTYEKLLAVAENQHSRQEETRSGNAFLEKLGQLGMVEVEEGRSGSVYIFRT